MDSLSWSATMAPSSPMSASASPLALTKVALTETDKPDSRQRPRFVQLSQFDSVPSEVEEAAAILTEATAMASEEDAAVPARPGCAIATFEDTIVQLLGRTDTKASRPLRDVQPSWLSPRKETGLHIPPSVRPYGGSEGSAMGRPSHRLKLVGGVGTGSDGDEEDVRSVGRPHINSVLSTHKQGSPPMASPPSTFLRPRPSSRLPHPASQGGFNASLSMGNLLLSRSAPATAPAPASAPAAALPLPPSATSRTNVGRVSFSVADNAPEGAVPLLGGKDDETVSIFPHSHWIRAKLEGLLACGAPMEEPSISTSSVSLERTQMGYNAEASAAAQAAAHAAQLHERRVAAAKQSQIEMLAFTAMLRRAEAESGAKAGRRPNPQRWKEHISGNGGTGSAAAVQTNLTRTNAERNASSEMPSRYDGRKSRLTTLALDRALARSARSRSVGDDSSGSDTFDDIRDSDDDGVDSEGDRDFVKGFSSHGSHRRRSRRTGGMGRDDVARRSSRMGGKSRRSLHTSHNPRDVKMPIARSISRAALYKLRDRTAREWVALQRRRVAHMRAGPSELERHLHESRQQLLRAQNAGETSKLLGVLTAPTRVKSTAADGALPPLPLPRAGSSSVAGTTLHRPELPSLLGSHAEGGGVAAARDGVDSLVISWGEEGVAAAAVAPPSAMPHRNDGGGLPTADDDASLRPVSALSMNAGHASWDVMDPQDRPDGGDDNASRGRDNPDRFSTAQTGVDLSLKNGSLRRDEVAKMPSLAATAATPLSAVAEPATETVCNPRREESGSVAVLPTSAVNNASLSPATTSMAVVSAAEENKEEEEERFLRFELQRLLAKANESGLYGLDRFLGPPLDASRNRQVRRSALATSGTPSMVTDAPSSATQRLALTAGMQGSVPTLMGVNAASPRTPCPSSMALTGLRVDVAACSPGSSPRQRREPAPLHTTSETESLAGRDGGVDGADGEAVSPVFWRTSFPSSPSRPAAAANPSPSTRTVTHVASCPSGTSGKLATATAATKAGQPRLPARRNNSHFLPTKKRVQRSPLPAAAGVGEHSKVLLQHELLLTRRWEMDVQQSHDRDVECTCATLQQLRPLRARLMEQDICQTHKSKSSRKRGVTQQPQQRRRSGSDSDSDVTSISCFPSAAAKLPAVVPLKVVRGTVDSVKEGPASRSPSLSHVREREHTRGGPAPLPHMVFARHRHIIYNEAVRMDTANRLCARAAYLEVLTRLAQRHVSSVSWPAVSSLLKEAQEWLQLEAERQGLDVLADAAAASGASPLVAALSAAPPKAVAPPHSTLPSTLFSASAAAPLQAQQAKSETLTLPYGGLQQLIANHLGVVELTQWPVQEVLQHLATLYHAPLSLLHEWIAELQRRYVHSYNYEERFRAVDQLMVGRTVRNDTAVRLTLHRCRRPPVTLPQVSGKAPVTMQGASRLEEVSSSSVPTPETALYYIRVRTALQSVASTAVPLSSMAASAFPGGSGGDSAGELYAPTGTAGGYMTGRAFDGGSSVSGAAVPFPSSSAKLLSFLGQTLTIYLSLRPPPRRAEQRRSEARRGSYVHRGTGDDGNILDDRADASEAVLAVELMQSGESIPLACGSLDLRPYGIGGGSEGNNGRMRPRNVQVALKRRGYRTASLKLMVEVL